MSKNPKTKSARDIRHEAEGKDLSLEAMQIRRDFAGIVLQPADVEAAPWVATSQLFFRNIEAANPDSYMLDLRTGELLRDQDLQERSKQEQKIHSRYRRASGKGWDPTEGVTEVTVTARPDLLMTLALVETKDRNSKLIDRIGRELAKRVEKLSQDPLHPQYFLRVNLVLVHTAASVAHWHLKVCTVHDGVLQWWRKPDGRMRAGKQGLCPLGMGKTNIMALVRSKLYPDGDDAAERAFRNRCTPCEGRYLNGLPLDFSLKCIADDGMEAYIRALGPKAVETLNKVQADYKEWLRAKYEGSDRNYKQKNTELQETVKMLRGKVSNLEKQMAELLTAIREGKLPAPTKALEPVIEPAKIVQLPAPKPLSARDTMQAVFKWGNPLGRLGQDPRDPTPAEWFKFNYVTLIEGTCDTPGWTYHEPKPTWEELSTIRDTLLKVPHAEQLEAVGKEVDAWFAAHPSPEPTPDPETAPVPEPAVVDERKPLSGVEEVDEFEEALAALNAAAKAKEEVKKPIEEPKPQPQEEPFFAPLEAEKKEEEEDEDIEAQIRSLGF